MAVEPIFETLFGSLARIKIMRWFLSHPEDNYDKKLIARFLKINQNILSKEMANLQKISFIARTKEKYFLDKSFPLAESLKSFISNPAPDFYDFLRNDFKSINGIKLAFAVGFFVGEEDAVTDFLLVVDKPNVPQIKNKISRLESQFGRELKYTLLSSSEFNYRYSMFDKFVRDILEGRHKVIINKIKNFSWVNGENDS